MAWAQLSYTVTVAPGRRLTAKTAAGLVKPGMWQRMRTGSATKGAKVHDWAMAEITPDDTAEGRDAGHAMLLLRRPALRRHRAPLRHLSRRPTPPLAAGAGRA